MRRDLLKPLYGLATARREWYGALKVSYRFRMETDMAKQVNFPRGRKDFHYVFGICLRCKCIGGNAKSISDANRDFGANGKMDFAGVLIPHVGDLLIYGTDDFIAYLPWRLGSEYGAKVFGGE